MKYILFAILAYVLYQLVFRFLIPVYFATKKIRKNFQEMQEKMNDQFRQQQNNQASNNSQPKKESKPAGEYIDFEEIR